MQGMIPSMATATANSSFAFVYLLSLVLLREKFDILKLLSVFACLGGVVLLALSSTKGQEIQFSTGILIEALCALAQAVYLVAFRKWGIKNGKLPALIAVLIAGCEGLAHLFLFWPMFFILNATGFEPFAWPSAEELRLLSLGATMAASGNLSSMAAVALLPSPFLVSVAILCQAPTNFIADLIVLPAKAKDVYSPYKVVGGLLILCSFGVVIWRDYILDQRSRAPRSRPRANTNPAHYPWSFQWRS